MCFVRRLAGVAAAVVRHAAWYVSYHVGGGTRRQD
jgi:hypothetical protein